VEPRTDIQRASISRSRARLLPGLHPPARATINGEKPASKTGLFNSSLERGLRILSIFDQGHRSLGLAQISEKTGIDKSAVQRFTSTLLELGYLRKDPATRHYTLSPRLLHLGSSFLRGNALVERATPYLLNCNKEWSQTVNLAVLDGAEIIIIVRIPSRDVVSPNVGLGSSFPWHVTALGQAIVAHLPTAERTHLIEGVTFHRYASRTIMSRAQLVQRLEQTRELGVVTSVSETFEGDISIAAPVFDYSGLVVAAVNVVGMTTKWRNEETEQFPPIVRSLADMTSSSSQSSRSVV
jgi:IclR family transcriptional regulator, pca regulon regulatory protein